MGIIKLLPTRSLNSCPPLIDIPTLGLFNLTLDRSKVIPTNVTVTINVRPNCPNVTKTIFLPF